LYCDKKFNNLLDIIAAKEKIQDFDDFRQDVFLDIIETNAKSYEDFKKCAWKIGLRYYRSAFEDDIYNYGINEDGEYSETEDDIMSRLVYEGKAIAL